MTWRSMLKSKACDVVPRFYKLGNQFAAEENLAVTQDLIKGSSFVQDGVDEEVSQPNNNMRANLVVTGIHEQLRGPRTVCHSYQVLLHWPFSSWPCPQFSPAPCHDRFLPVGHWFKGGSKVR